MKSWWSWNLNLKMGIYLVIIYLLTDQIREYMGKQHEKPVAHRFLKSVRFHKVYSPPENSGIFGNFLLCVRIFPYSFRNW